MKNKYLGIFIMKILYLEVIEENAYLKKAPLLKKVSKSDYGSWYTAAIKLQIHNWRRVQDHSVTYLLQEIFNFFDSYNLFTFNGFLKILE